MPLHAKRKETQMQNQYKNPNPSRQILQSGLSKLQLANDQSFYLVLEVCGCCNTVDN